jgi:hypothetical protein
MKTCFFDKKGIFPLVDAKNEFYLLDIRGRSGAVNGFFSGFQTVFVFCTPLIPVKSGSIVFVTGGAGKNFSALFFPVFFTFRPP